MIDHSSEQSMPADSQAYLGSFAYLSRRFWGHSGHVLILHGCGMFIGYFVHLCLVRWMGSTEYGMLSYANSVNALVGITVALGLPVAAVRFVPEYRVKRRYAELKGFLKFGGWLTFLFALAVGGSLYLATWHFGLFPGADREIMALSLLFALPVSALAGWQFEVFRGQQRVFSVLWFQHLAAPALLILTCLALFKWQKDLSAFEVLVLMTLIAFGGWFGLAVFQSRLWRGQLENIKAVFPFKVWFRVSLPLFLTGLFLVFMAQIDILLVGSLLGPQKAGIYALAAKLSGLVCIFLNAANVLAAPIYMNMYSQNKHLEMKKFARRISHMIFWPAAAVAIILIMFGVKLLGWFGPEFQDGYLVVVFLVAGQLVNAGSGSVGYLADLTGLQGPAAIIRAGCAALNLLLSWVFINIWGMTGAAIATAVCLILWNMLLHRLVSIHRNISPSIFSTLVKPCPR